MPCLDIKNPALAGCEVGEGGVEAGKLSGAFSGGHDDGRPVTSDEAKARKPAVAQSSVGPSGPSHGFGVCVGDIEELGALAVKFFLCHGSKMGQIL